MKFGLPDKVVEKIQHIFAENARIEKAIVFGSRAKGNYKEGSDIDIAIKGQDLNFDDTLSLLKKLDDLELPYEIDLINYHTIKEPDLKDHIDRVGIELYSRWKEIKLGDITKLVTKGTTPSSLGGKFIDKGINYIKSEAVSYDGKIDKSTFVFIDEEMHLKLKRSQLAKDDILYSMAGIFLGKNGMVTEDMLPANTNQALAIIRLKQEVAKPKFIHYYLRQKSVIDFVNNMSGQSAQPNINFEEIKAIDISLPPIQEQTAIASILSSLDDKIDLLHRQNKTLEQLAETLFRQWFVEEAEESWEVKPLGKIFDIGIGRTPPRKEQHWFTLNPNDVKWVSIKDMGTSGIYIDTVSEYLTQEAVEKYSVPVIPENTVMLSFKMTIGRLAISTERMVSNEAIAHFKQKEGSFLFPEFLYLFLKTYSWVELGSTSSIVESINSQMIKEIEIAIPNNQKLIAFKGMVKPTFDKIKSNQIQIRTLTQTRNTLLPKLMSGEVRVKSELLSNPYKLEKE